ncbi:MAG: hypothetical protein SGJ00_07570 [bacterium]|nr:hypothetical protein [bacterium]
MKTELFALSIIQLVLSIFIVVLVLYFTVTFMRYWFKKRGVETNNNLAFSIVGAAVLFSTGYIISGAIQPIINAIRQLSIQYPETMSQSLQSVKFVLLFVALGFLVSLISNFTGFGLYNILTKDHHEIQDIKEGKVSTAILVATVIMVIALFVKDSYILMLESLIPYPDMPVRFR